MLIKLRLLAVLFLIPNALAYGSQPDKAQLQQQLTDFLRGASVNAHQQHQQFWAQELIYTSSSGKRFGKDELMTSVRSSATLDNASVTSWYGAKDVSITLYGDVATLAFTLTASAANSDEPTKEFLNTGTFVWRDGRWQAVLWQATIKAQ